MKATEYGGSDTTKTLGIQPAPHALTASEKIRIMYSGDPMSEEPEIIKGLEPSDG